MNIYNVLMLSDEVQEIIASFRDEYEARKYMQECFNDTALTTSKSLTNCTFNHVITDTYCIYKALDIADDSIVDSFTIEIQKTELR